MEKSDAPKQANSMRILNAMGEKLISANTAIGIAKMVTLDRYGQAELDRSSPLNVLLDGNTWVVTGTYHKEFEEQTLDGRRYNGPFRMIISSLDGQILSYTFMPNLPWLKTSVNQGSG